ncbi:tRNA (N6-isopentenyl adenosine(37)-C2)-methylthiotransferase MiaB [Candidatus Pelagibacter bacterium]|nr:tRNA (N6-isopentenyl adenosine(37)-C2)-methylthiotransferase MiaB [Candidatus Pelagibacter bacterium]
MQKKIFIKTLGCQMNEYDSARISDLTKKINYNLTNNIGEADCYVLNTCHIREKATVKVYHDIGRVKKEFRNKKKPIVIVTGCVAQAEGDVLLKNEKYIDAVIGPQSYHEINNTILNLEKNFKKFNSTEFEVIEKFDTLNNIKNSDSKVSSFLTIQEGCDKFCKFCVVPYTRGAEFSRSVNELVFEATQLVENGSKEITLLGQNVNAYNFEEKKLSDLILKISEIKGLKRIRYTTSHPRDFTEDLITVHKDCKKLMPLIHLPVQSGSNKILESMNRKHTVEEYLEIIEKLKKVNPNIKFSSDFILGYPGETQEDFEKTLELMNKVKFISSYSFIFSARPGTPSFKLKKIDDNVTKERLIIFQDLAKKIKTEYRKTLLSRTIPVLFENKTKKNNQYFGRDECFNSIIVESNENITGKIKNVSIIKVSQNTLFGEINSKLVKKKYAA